jgi:periplasmic divalent cation tolerance protein
MSEVSDVIVVWVTVPNPSSAESLAKILVERRLAACVNIIPGVKSLYIWEDQMQTDSEEILLIKTKRTLFQDLAQAIQQNHPYSVPEIIASPIVLGSESYLNFVRTHTN